MATLQFSFPHYLARDGGGDGDSDCACADVGPAPGHHFALRHRSLTDVSRKGESFGFVAAGLLDRDAAGEYSTRKDN